MSKPRGWMRKLCEERFPKVGAPFRINVRGASWDCATNGHAMLLARGATFRVRGAGPLLSEIEPLLRLRPYRIGWVDLADLRWQAETHRDTKTGCFQLSVLGVTINGNLLARYLPRELEASKPVKVVAAGALDVVRFEAEDWVLLVMPMRVPELRLMLELPKPAKKRKAVVDG